jgi:UDP-3-O-[3-hydroxymyristoyl] N-acetylglucosamine deacetylase
MHKILDCLGDLVLSDYKILGKITCSQGGHKLTNEFLRKFFSDKSNYSIVEFNEKKLPNTVLYNKGLAATA